MKSLKIESLPVEPTSSLHYGPIDPSGALKFWTTWAFYDPAKKHNHLKTSFTQKGSATFTN